jgi:hypothetical protein
MSLTSEFWNQILQYKDDPDSVRCKGWHYTIFEDSDKTYDNGYGGMGYIIKFFDGREAETTNLRCNGEIPEEYKELLPDNANIIMY